MSNFVNLLDIVYPVGSIYQSMNATSPADSIGGTWTKIKTFLYGADTAKKTGGETTHTLTVNEMPAHSHSVNLHYADNSGNNTGHTSYWGRYGSSPYWTATVGGGQHTTTCRPTQLASSGTERLNYAESELSKFKRGGVCLTSLTF